MLLRPTKSIRTTLFPPQIIAKDGIFLPQSQLRRDSSPLPAAPSSGRISPAILFIIVIVAIIFFIAGLLHLLVRFLARKQSRRRRRRPGGAGAEAAASPADALQRQLQQLFHLHDAGLDQAFIDALPVFPYRDIADSSDEPFDCAVCLCEFTPDDRLRLLPVCGHAFHLSCIDTWLLSNSTCPLCRGSLFVPGLAIENPIFEFDGGSDEERPSSRFPVRLGKFMNLSNPNGNTDGGEITDTGESSSSQLDARRCYSMGSYQYVVADASLQVELPRVNRKSGDSKGARGSGEAAAEEGKRLGIGSRGESFSVSKIWLWSNKKGKHPISGDASSLDGGLPWMKERTSVRDS